MSPAATVPFSPQATIDQSRRDWFLCNSHWGDAIWRFAPTSVLEEEHPVRLSWDFALPNGRRFTEPPSAVLLESARRLIAIVRTRSLGARVAQRAITAQIYFHHLRALLRWMDGAGFARFDALDSTAIADFQQEVAARTRHDGKRIAPTTLARHLRMFTYLHRYRALIGDGLTFDPWPGGGTHAAAGVHRH